MCHDRQCRMFQCSPRAIWGDWEHVRGRRLFAFLAAALLLSAGARAEESSGFTLETGSPDALCPALEVAREAVTRRLGALVVEGRWRARYTIAHVPSGTPGDFVRLELFNPEGRAELVRDLPIEGESCRTMAEVIALVLDRYFRGLVAHERQTESTTAAPVERASPVEPRLAATPAATARDDVDARPVLDRRLALEYAVSHPLAAPWLGLRGSGGLGPHLETLLAIRVALAPFQESEPRGASVETRPVAARAGMAWRLVLPPGLLHVGPVGQVAVEQATTQGLVSENDHVRARWSAGLESGFVAPASRSLFVQTAVSAELLISSGRFFIEDREVLVPPRLMVGWSLGIGYY
jgi:hypothetical protein